MFRDWIDIPYTHGVVTGTREGMAMSRETVAHSFLCMDSLSKNPP